MTAKEYLNQACYSDQQINNKLEQIESLRDMATRATSTIPDVPPSGTRNFHSMESIIVKMVDLEHEINSDLGELVAIKHEIFRVIKLIDSKEQQTLLEKRFLCFGTWEQIAVAMGCSIQNVYKLRDKAVEAVENLSLFAKK
jgi:hypothetical protein